MRDAFGGAFLVKLLLIFLSLYIAFMAVSLNYAKAFRVKNGIIDIVEQQEGYTDDTKTRIISYLAGKNYYLKVDKCESESNILEGDTTKTYGYCIYRKGTEEKPYYLVETFIHIELPFLNISMNIPIKGETRVITNNKSES